LKKNSPNAIRLLLLSYYWREPWEFREEELDNAEEKVTVMKSAIAHSSTNRHPEFAEGSPESASQSLLSDEADLSEFEKIMDDDLYTPRALEYLCKLAEEILEGKREDVATLKKSLEILGFRI